MNLDILNGGQVSSKPWLNPVCNVLRCNNLIAGNIVGGSAESCSYTNGAQINNIALGFTSGINTAILVSPNFNPATSVYTVAISGVYRASISLCTSTNVVGTNNAQVLMTINGANTSAGIGAVQTSVPASFCRNTVTANWLGPLVAGNTIGFRYDFVGTDAGAFIGVGTCMFIVEKL